MASTTSAGFAAQERAAQQQLATAVAAVPTGLARGPRDGPAAATPVTDGSTGALSGRLALLKLEKLGLIQSIVRQQRRVAGLTRAYAEAAARAEEAAKKGAVTGVSTAVVTVVAAALSALGTSFTADGLALLAALASALGAQQPFLAAAAAAGHPLAAEYAAILARMAAALRAFTREREQERHDAIARLLAELEATLASLERLPRLVAGIKGPCLGDPAAAFDTADAVAASLDRAATLVRQTGDPDLQPLAAGLATLRAALSDALATLRPRG